MTYPPVCPAFPRECSVGAWRAGWMGGGRAQHLTEPRCSSELLHWSHGQFPFFGELLDLVWLTQEEALQLAPEIFGVVYCFAATS